MIPFEMYFHCTNFELQKEHAEIMFSAGAEMLLNLHLIGYFSNTLKELSPPHPTACSDSYC